MFITGADKKANRQAALEAGCVAYLEKPFPSSALINSTKPPPAKPSQQTGFSRHERGAATQPRTAIWRRAVNEGLSLDGLPRPRKKRVTDGEPDASA